MSLNWTKIQNRLHPSQLIELEKISPSTNCRNKAKNPSNANRLPTKLMQLDQDLAEDVVSVQNRDERARLGHSLIRIAIYQAQTQQSTYSRPCWGTFYN